MVLCRLIYAINQIMTLFSVLKQALDWRIEQVIQSDLCFMASCEEYVLLNEERTLQYP